MSLEDPTVPRRSPTLYGDLQDVFHHENTDLDWLRQNNRTMLDVPKVIWFSVSVWECSEVTGYPYDDPFDVPPFSRVKQ